MNMIVVVFVVGVLTGCRGIQATCLIPNGVYKSHSSGEVIKIHNEDVYLNISSVRYDGKFQRNLKYELMEDGEIYFFPKTSNESIEYSQFFWHGECIFRETMRRRTYFYKTSVDSKYR